MCCSFLFSSFNPPPLSSGFEQGYKYGDCSIWYLSLKLALPTRLLTLLKGCGLYHTWCASSGVYQRIIRVERPLSAGTSGYRHHLHFRQIEAYNTAGVKLRLHLADPPTDPCGGHKGCDPGVTIDGNYDTMYHSSFEDPTMKDSIDKWLEYMLPPGPRIARIKIWNRADEVCYRFVGVVLTIRDRYADGTETEVYKHVFKDNQVEYVVDIPGVSGASWEVQEDLRKGGGGCSGPTTRPKCPRTPRPPRGCAQH